MTVHSPDLEAYLSSLLPDRNSVLADMEAYAREHKFPIIGPLVGRFLQQMVRLTNARRVFEMGSGYGYSAIWFATAMEDGGLVECTETDAANISRGRAFAQAAGFGDRIVWHQSDALEAMGAAKGAYDIILNDVDKHQYPRALELAWPQLRRGGVMITDNVLWSNRVINEKPPTPGTAGILEFNRSSYALPDALSVIIPLRDGLMVSFKQ